MNILSGRIDQMKGSPFGMLLVELRGSSQEKDAALCFLEENQVEVEVLSP